MVKIIDKIDETDKVSFYTFDGTVGINVSGGADSALLLYFTLLHQPGKIHVMTLGNNQKYRRNVNIAIKVIEKCIQLTNNSNVIHHIHNTDIQTGDKLEKVLKYYYDKDIVNVVMGATTANPPKHITDTFIHPNTEHDERNPEETRDVFYRDWPNDEIIGYQPFINVDKKEIAQIYEKNNLMDLFSITRSCEFNPIDVIRNGALVDPGMGHCGRCWWCEERKWAFGRL